MNLLRVAVGLLCVSFCRSSSARTSNSTDMLQATWLPVSYLSTTEQEIFDVMNNLKQKGVGRVYVDVWNQGIVYFQSPTMKSIVGDTGVGDDHLAWSLRAGAILDIEVYAWFEYGLICSYESINNDFAKHANSSGWVLGVYGGFYWLDPTHPDVLDFTTGIMIDAMRGYESLGLKGVQWDDHLASPVGLGKSVSDMDNVMRRVYEAFESVEQTSVQLSLSPATLSTALDTYNVDWNKWGTQGLFQEVIPQLYRSTFEAFKSEYDLTLQSLSPTCKTLWIASGVRVNGSGDPTPWPDVQLMLNYSNADGIGSSVWYAKGILELYPEEFESVWT